MSAPGQLQPLGDAELPPQVLRVVGTAAPASMKLMAARGLAPLPPPDLVIALYQLAATGDETIQKTASDSAARLPDPVLRVALQAPLPAPVLDFFARRLYTNYAALGLLLDNRGLPDVTVEFLATVCEGEALDRIAKDEQRLLRAPAIIAALYMNPKTPSSTAMRAVELAARNNIVVDIPGFEDLVTSLTGVVITTAHDAAFQEVVSTGKVGPLEGDVDADKLSQEDIERTQAEEEAAVARGTEAEKKKVRFEEMPVPLQIRAATLGNAFDRSVAIRSTVKTVAMAAIRSPAITVQEVIKYAANRALHEDVIRYISNRREWTQLNAVRLGLINNNKCPLGTSMRLLNFVHNRDLKAISRSKNVPGPLVKGAKELLAKREKR